MTIEDKSICDVIAGSPEAEDVLEEAGVDYWFGWERMLGAACKADPDELAGRLASCRPCAGGESQPATLAALLRGSDEQWRMRLAPSITTAVAAAARLTNGRGDGADRLLKELQRGLERHMTTSRSLVPMAESIERAEAGSVDRDTIRAFSSGASRFRANRAQSAI